MTVDEATCDNGAMLLHPAGYPIRAVSMGGVETCYDVAAFDVCLDIGRCPPGAELRSRLLLTHAHIDHAAGLPYYVSMRSMLKYSPPRIFVPEASYADLQAIMAAWCRLQADTDRCTLQPVRPGDTIPLGGQRFARVFHSPHRIACNGYALCRRKRKLKKELAGLPESEIARLARAGETVDEWVEVPELCFPGDTNIEVVENEPLVRTSKVLLLECTFLGAQVSVEKARKGGHIHLDELAARADLFENEVVVLTHFSRRFSRNDIQSAVDRQLPEHLKRRIQLLLPDA